VVKLVDFGIAKLRESGAHTQTGMVLGTPAYMSFEQASGMRSDELDARSDVYSLGVVVYEMLTGRTPFHSDTPVGYLRMHMQEAPPPFRAVKPNLPPLPQLESVVMKALAKDRNQRYRSVLEFAQEFTQAAEVGSKSAAWLEPQKEAVKPQPQSTQVHPPKTTVADAVGDTVAAKAVAEPAHPSRRTWLVARFRWRRVGIVASIVWILGAGIYTLKVQGDVDSNFVSQKTQSCIDAYNFKEPVYEECLKQGYDTVMERLPSERIEAAFVAFVPVLLAWGFIYLVLFLVRWISRPPVAARTPQVLAIPEPLGKMKFVAIAGVALILIVAGVWYFSPRGPKDLNPDGSIKRGDVAWSAKAGTSRGEVRVNPNDGLKYVWIPAGSFMMGCSAGDTKCLDNEKPAHQVTLTKGLWLGQTEVTVGAYKRFAVATGHHMPPNDNLNGGPLNAGWGDEAQPIVNVSWDDAHNYCTWAGGRLPTEAEWEYAARGGTAQPRYGAIDEIAWYSNNSGQKTHEVAQKRANGFGLFDMLGNVWEWVNDRYEENYYHYSPSEDPIGPTSGWLRVQRGGSYSSMSASVSVRWGNSGGEIDFGFRCGGDVSGH
jgi:formylglycine-generating enzyme required for sulfatase activity